jgi:hypothetical protein
VLPAALPALVAGSMWACNIAKNWSDKSEEAQKGVFADAHLTLIARAIDRNDSAAVRKLASEKIDFNARDKWDHTLLDHAVDRTAAIRTRLQRSACSWRPEAILTRQTSLEFR